jgi:hypothetical protein
MYYSLLKEEFKNCGRRDSLESYQFLNLKEIKNALDSGNISQKRWLKNGVKVPTIKPEKTIKQNELVKKIHNEGLFQLRNILNDNIDIYNIEHPCGPYGTVDMVYKGIDTIYPIEVKRGRGEHDLIGQIGKYELYHRLRIHYKHYKKVQAITICHSYDKFVFNELRKMKVFTLLYTIINQRISIKMI